MPVFFADFVRVDWADVLQADECCVSAVLFLDVIIGVGEDLVVVFLCDLADFIGRQVIELQDMSRCCCGEYGCC